MTALLLWSQDLGRAFSRYSQRSGSLSENSLLIAVTLAIVAFWTVLYFWEQRRRRRVREGQTPHDLLLELSHAHHLDRHERALLTQIVAARRLSQPALLFIDPDLLGPPADAGEPMDAPPEDPACVALRAKLFGPS